MDRRIVFAGLLAACALAACAAPMKPAPAPVAPAPTPAPATPQPAPAPVVIPAPETPAEPVIPEASPGAGVAPDRETFAGWLAALRRASCPKGQSAVEPASIGLTARPITLDRLGSGRTAVGALRFVGGFHLTSPDARFGGLSGLAVRDDGGLLAVSDAGAFVWIDLADDNLTPKEARLSPMQNGKGQGFADKADADAEGLALLDGLALVSFEQDHRVMAFDLAACGAAARAAGIPGMKGAIQAAFDRRSIPASGNTGIEALAVSPDGMLLQGVEQLVSGSAPLSARVMEEPPSFDLSAGPGSPQVTGMDLLGAGDRDERLFSLHRAPSLFGEAIAIWETTLRRRVDSSGLPAKQADEMTERAALRYRKSAERKLASMSALPFNIDNFEGIAARRLPDGAVRLYIVSDDNFSSSQRTLLMAFDVDGK